MARPDSLFPLRVGQDNVSQTRGVRQLCMQSGTWKASAVKSIAVAFFSTKLTSLCRIFELWLPIILIWIISSFNPVHFPGFSCKAKVTQTLFAGSETPAFPILRFHSLPQQSILFYLHGTSLGPFSSHSMQVGLHYLRNLLQTYFFNIFISLRVSYISTMYFIIFTSCYSLSSSSRSHSNFFPASPLSWLVF